MPDFAARGGAAFSFGAMAATPLAPHFSVSSAVAGAAAVTLASADAAASALRDALLADSSEHAGDLAT
eukprot:648030-Pleurochrysis_carterae.AAC.1